MKAPKHVSPDAFGSIYWFRNGVGPFLLRVDLHHVHTTHSKTHQNDGPSSNDRESMVPAPKYIRPLFLLILMATILLAKSDCPKIMELLEPVTMDTVLGFKHATPP